jgi:hypothetical protein
MFAWMKRFKPCNPLADLERVRHLRQPAGLVEGEKTSTAHAVGGGRMRDNW